MTDAKAEAGSEDAAPGYDSILLVSFGGPEKREDVMPFLENVVRGKRVPNQAPATARRRGRRFGAGC